MAWQRSQLAVHKHVVFTKDVLYVVVIGTSVDLIEARRKYRHGCAFDEQKLTYVHHLNRPTPLIP